MSSIILGLSSKYSYNKVLYWYFSDIFFREVHFFEIDFE